MIEISGMCRSWLLSLRSCVVFAQILQLPVFWAFNRIVIFFQNYIVFHLKLSYDVIRQMLHTQCLSMTSVVVVVWPMPAVSVPQGYYAVTKSKTQLSHEQSIVLFISFKNNNLINSNFFTHQQKEQY